MQQWEYVEVDVESASALAGSVVAAKRINDKDIKRDLGNKEYPRFHQLANELGDQGWEMTGIASSAGPTYFKAYFRRPKP